VAHHCNQREGGLLTPRRLQTGATDVPLRYPDLFPPRLAESFAGEITAAAGARMRAIMGSAEPGPAP
jgi:hypothetical protein